VRVNKSLHVLVGVVLSIVMGAAAARAELVRPGDQLKIRLVRAFNAMSAHSGDGFAVTLPEGFQADPRGKPEIPAGTTGTATFRLLDGGNPAQVKYEISSLLLELDKKRVEIKTAFPSTDATAGTLTVQKANPMLKLFVPPIIGVLIWKDRAVLPAGKEITIEAAEQKKW
jgi:hypothetical protein